ncbi:MAG: sulfite exporter TauE/SafE family protein [Cyanobacteria bacterium K_DeepCast_35m_m2_023]|nr:sulfite exporter TauE/SafE family protein [Cyanobacteria bacterium K_DeepCast_35m_m2_023]
MAAPALIAALAVVAFLYSVVGHAGASGYIAVLALAGQSPEQIKPLALLLNTAVASIGCCNFLRAGHLPWSRLWPVYVLAVPAAFLGGWLHLPSVWFRRLVGVVLLFAAWRLGVRAQDPTQVQPPRPAVLAASGGALGLLAGLTGTGGGVFLTPLLLLCRWCSTRQAAAVSVLFILLNSIAGLAGLWWARPELLAAQWRPELLAMLAAVALSGGIGSGLGSRHWPVVWIRRVLAGVLVLAGLNLLVQSL